MHMPFEAVPFNTVSWEYAGGLNTDRQTDYLEMGFQKWLRVDFKTTLLELRSKSYQVL